MNNRAEDLVRRYFAGEVEGVAVPPVPEVSELRRRRVPGDFRRRVPVAEMILAAAACLCVIFTSSLQVPPSALAQKTTDFARTREVGNTITRGLENARRAVGPILVQGENK